MSHIRIKNNKGNVISIPLLRANWDYSGGSGTYGGIVFNSNGTITCNYLASGHNVIKYKTKSFYSFYNEGYKYLKYKFMPFNVSANVFVIGAAEWVGYDYRGSNGDWACIQYMQSGNYIIFDNIKYKTYSDGVLVGVPQFKVPSGNKYISIGLNTNPQTPVTITKILLAKHLYDLL